MRNRFSREKFRRRYSFLWCGILCFSFQAGEPVHAESGKSESEYIRKVAENVKKNRILEMSYMFEMTQQKLTLGRNSEITDQESRTFEITPVEDGYYRKLVKKDGKPLSPNENKNEENKLFESQKKNANLSLSEQNKLEKKRLERRQKEERFWNEVVKAFDFMEQGGEPLEGRATRVFQASPRPQYVPDDRDFELLKKIRGKIWIDAMDDQVVRADIEFIDDIRLAGGLLAKVNKGGTFTVLQKKVYDEVWFPSHSEIAANGRLLLFKGFNLKILTDFGNYRKFEATVNLVSPTEENE